MGRKYYVVMEYHTEREVFLECKAFCREEEAQKMLKSMQPKERFEIREMTRDELLQMRLQMYEENVAQIERHWRSLGLMGCAMFGIVYSLHKKLKMMRPEDVELAFKRHESIVSDVEEFSRREDDVQLKAEFMPKGEIVLHEWTWDGPDHIEDTKIIVRKFESFADLSEWAGNWDDAEEDCLTALLKDWKRRYRDHYMTLPQE